MSTILYYSTYCDNCSKLLQMISTSNSKKDMHFINIDKRVKKSNGATYLILENGQEIIHMPSTGLCYSYCNFPVLLGTLSSDFKTIIKDEINNQDL